MKYILACIAIIGCLNIQAQILDRESDWVNNGLRHSTQKSFSFENIESLLDTTKITKWDVFPSVLGSYYTKNPHFQTQIGAGVALETGFKKKIAFQLRYELGYGYQTQNNSFSSGLQTKAYFENRLPLKNSNASEQFIYNDLRFRFTYRPIRQIELQAGIDNQHYGEGDRSIFLGTQAGPSPFVSFKGKIWHFEYTFMQQLWSEGMFTSSYAPKGNVSHYISYKINKNLHLGIFESVVYGMKDTLYNRGYELEYLNPFIFFRPQEYSLGSTDNVLLGLDISYQFDKNMIYGSFLFDDFLLSELRARSRWWANKYTAQIGIKSYFGKGNHHFFHRFEATFVRPFTYSQIRPDVVYANAGLPAAHPLGANFVELYDEINWKYKRFDFTLFLQYYLKGFSLPNDNTGGNIYQPYDERKEDYHYTIGRGITTWHYAVGAHLGYQLHHQRWQVFIEPRLLIDKVEKKTSASAYFMIGIQRPIGAYRRNY